MTLSKYKRSKLTIAGNAKKVITQVIFRKVYALYLNHQNLGSNSLTIVTTIPSNFDYFDITMLVHV